MPEGIGTNAATVIGRGLMRPCPEILLMPVGSNRSNHLVDAAR